MRLIVVILFGLTLNLPCLKSQDVLRFKLGLVQDIWLSENNGHQVYDDFTYTQRPILGHYSYKLRPKYYRGSYDPSEIFLPTIHFAMHWTDVWKWKSIQLGLETMVSAPDRVHNRGNFMINVNLIDPQSGLIPSEDAHPIAGSTIYGWSMSLAQCLTLKIDKMPHSMINIGMKYINRSIINWDLKYGVWEKSPFDPVLWSPLPTNNGTKEIIVSDYQKIRNMDMESLLVIYMSLNGCIQK